MRTTLVSTALAAVLAASTAIPAAHADRDGRGWQGGKHYSHGYRGGRHHGHGYWRGGKWIALGVLGAAALNALDDDDCYRTRGGRVVCR